MCLCSCLLLFSQSAADNCSGASSLKPASVYPLKEELNPFTDINASRTLIDTHCLYSWHTGPEYTDEISGRPGRETVTDLKYTG